MNIIENFSQQAQVLDRESMTEVVGGYVLKCPASCLRSYQVNTRLPERSVGTRVNEGSVVGCGTAGGVVGAFSRGRGRYECREVTVSSGVEIAIPFFAINLSGETVRGSWFWLSCPSRRSTGGRTC